MGAILPDSVLQAGLNYTTVVRPRVLNILQDYPQVDTISALVKLVRTKQTGVFLSWQHHEKVTRFTQTSRSTSLMGLVGGGVSDLRENEKNYKYGYLGLDSDMHSRLQRLPSLLRPAWKPELWILAGRVGSQLLPIPWPIWSLISKRARPIALSAAERTLMRLEKERGGSLQKPPLAFFYLN